MCYNSSAQIHSLGAGRKGKLAMFFESKENDQIKDNLEVITAAELFAQLTVANQNRLIAHVEFLLSER